MKITTLCRLALLGAPALLAWPAAAPWAFENTAVPATTPTSDFTLDDVNGTAYHKKTGLTWKRCAEGWDWDGSTCIDNESVANTYTWSQALQRGPTLGTFAGFSDWRLPNQKELNSIVEQRNWYPAINATVFRNTPATNFWSASPYAPNAGLAWYVVFYFGYDVADVKGSNYAVRLVRGGQYSLLSVSKDGGGSGTVTSSPPGIECGEFCQGSFADELLAAGQVRLTAAAAPGAFLVGWTGCQHPLGLCTVEPGGTGAVTATFGHIAIGGFGDVPVGYWAEAAIYALRDAGITVGCGGGNYCPSGSVSRAQMAVFLERALHGVGYTPPAATGLFADVPAGYWAATWIEALYADGVTGGCAANPLRYCPEEPVTRAQMAVFLLRARHGQTYVPPAATGTVFGDVPPSYWAVAWIEQLAREGITTGCGGGDYCPDSPVARDQMAVFLSRTFLGME